MGSFCCWCCGCSRRALRSLVFLATLVAAAAVLVNYVKSAIEKTASLYSYSGAVASIRFAALEAIRNADGPEAWYGTGEAPRQLNWVFVHVLKAFLGRAWVHPSTLSLDLTSLTLPQDSESRFCRHLLGYAWVHPDESGGFVYPSIYAGGHDVDLWIEACKATHKELGVEEKTLLEPYRSSGSIPRNVLFPDPDDHDRIKIFSRIKANELVYEPSERYTREELVELGHKSIAMSAWHDAVQEPPESILDYYTTMNLRRPIRIEPTWEAVGQATRAGQIASFDARSLLPKELFNVSFHTMSQWEGEHSKRIPVHGDGILPTSLESFAARLAMHCKEAHRRKPISIIDEDLATVNGRPSALDRIQRDRMNRNPLNFAPAGYVHTRRLPEFHKKLPEVEKLMGIDNEVLRAQSMLWLSSTPGGFHYDEEANVYVQLSGETFAFLVPQNYTDAFTGAVRHPWRSGGLPGWQELERDPWLTNVPIYLLHLRPGDGVTLQSRTYHRFMAQTSDRVSLNWFFIPKWRKMEYNPSDWYSQEAVRSLERLALRQLWARSLSKVFDDTGRGIVFMGTKLEYL